MMSLKSPIYVDFPFPKTDGEIIDVRSEREFIDDHIPGAINLPVLKNKEREKVGKLYKQVSVFEARKLGASLISNNISDHIKRHFLAKNPSYSPFIYCWRGGQRSHSLAVILAQIGWQVKVLEGGYKRYRHYVCQQLETLPLQFNYHVICGLSGTGKTRLLHQLACEDYQVLDLEKIANHRGSLLGQEWKNTIEAQPSQKYFDSLLLQTLQQFDPSQPVFVESESYKIGDIYLPGSLWKKLKQSPGIEIQLSLEKRVDLLLQDYLHLMENTDFLKEKIRSLKSRYGWEKLSQWLNWIDQGKWREFVKDLLLTHYDPAYQRSLKKTYSNIIQKIDISNDKYTNIDQLLTKLKCD